MTVFLYIRSMIKYRIHLAEMGEASPTAVIEELYCKDGDIVEKDQTVMDVDTDKATLEVPSPIGGKIDFVVRVGQELKVGELLFFIHADVTFEVGDQVRCVDLTMLSDADIKPPLMLNQEYPVKGIVVDSKGNQHLDVGLESKYNYIRSLETQEELDQGEKIHWCHPSRFIKV